MRVRTLMEFRTSIAGFAARLTGRAVAAALGVAALGGCHLDMWDQARYKPLDSSTFFADGMAARPQVPGTVPYKMARLDTHYYTGKTGPSTWGEFPESIEIDRAFIERGRQRYEIFCSPCHGFTGQGDGMIVLRGFKQPPTYHSDRLRGTPPGYFVDVITNGFGTMYSYASRVEPADRWAIAAYIRVLQYSQSAPLEDAPEDYRQKLLALEDGVMRLPAEETSHEAAADHAEH